MKIEIGESLIYSWLRYVKGCQIAQLNWKTATVNDMQLQKVENLYDIFKEEMQLKSTLPQFLRQAEIDVLGIKTTVNSYEIYAVDIAFHEAGLQYFDSTERVIKKLLRSALVLHNQFDIKKGKLIFACPKINKQSTIDDIQDRLSKMTKTFKEFGFEFSFEFICNKNFQTEILNAVLVKSKEIKDTSDLFIRAVKMLGIFNAEIGSINLNKTIDLSEPIESIPDVDTPLQYLKDIYLISYSELLNSNLKIGKKVQYFFNKLIADKKLTLFFNKNSHLSLRGFPILVEVTGKVPEEIRMLKTDPKGYVRYYADPIKENGKSFLLCSQWYEEHLPILSKAKEDLNLN